MNYKVWYKKTNGIFWKKVSNVEGDFIAEELSTKPRVLMLADKSRLEIPTKDMLFKFCPMRFIKIKDNMEKEVGQKLPL